MNLNDKQFDINMNLKKEYKKCRKCNEVKELHHFYENRHQCIQCYNYVQGCKRTEHYTSKYLNKKRIEETIRRFKNATA